MAINTKYSYKSLNRQSFTKIDPKDFTGEIIGSSFFQINPFTDVFPPNLTGVIFTRCNLDNCNVPIGCVVVGGTNKHIKIQNDQEYWIVDDQLKPISPRDPDKFDLCNLSKDSKDIPIVTIEEPIAVTYDPKIVEERKIQDLIDDKEKLKQILIDEGTLSSGVLAQVKVK